MADDPRARTYSAIVDEIVRMIAETVCEVAEEGQQAVPAGPIYAALLDHAPGMTADQFNGLVDVGVKRGWIRRRGNTLLDKGTVTIPKE